MSQKPVPSRIELIRLRRQAQLFNRIRKTLEDARNSTIQRIRAIIKELEEERRGLREHLQEIALNYRIAIGKMGIDKLQTIADLTPKTVVAELTVRQNYSTVELKGVLGSPQYSLVDTPTELDLALTKLKDLLPRLIGFAEREMMFYMLLARVREYQRMINAIDNVILPRIQENIRFIRLALEEQEREDFIRRQIMKTLY